ncbi:helix-turn-helix domain-containing protein [Bacteroidota bacterium]
MDQKGYSHKSLAFECELDRTFISTLERGLRQPSLVTIVKISTVFEIKPSKLLREVEKIL